MTMLIVKWLKHACKFCNVDNDDDVDKKTSDDDEDDDDDEDKSVCPNNNFHHQVIFEGELGDKWNLNGMFNTPYFDKEMKSNFTVQVFFLNFFFSSFFSTFQRDVQHTLL